VKQRERVARAVRKSDLRQARQQWVAKFQLRVCEHCTVLIVNLDLFEPAILRITRRHTMNATHRNALSIVLISSFVVIWHPAVTHAQNIGNSDGSIVFSGTAPTGSSCSVGVNCTVSLSPTTANVWTMNQTFNNLLLSSGGVTGSGFELVGSASASGTVPTFLPRADDTNAGIGAHSAGELSFICDASGATECGRFDTSANFSILQGSFLISKGAEQIGTSLTNPIATNSDNSSVSLIEGTLSPTASGGYDSAEIVNITIAPPATFSPLELNSEQHIVTFAGCSSCDAVGHPLNLLSGHSNQLKIDASWADTNPILLVSSYNPGPLVNGSTTTQVTKYVLYDSPSGDYTGQTNTTLSNAEFDGLLVYGPTTIPGCTGPNCSLSTLTNCGSMDTCGTLSLNDVNLTVPAASPTVPGTTESVDAIRISGSCGTPGTYATLNCNAIDNESTAPNIFKGPTGYYNGSATAPSLANGTTMDAGIWFASNEVDVAAHTVGQTYSLGENTLSQFSNGSQSGLVLERTDGTVAQNNANINFDGPNASSGNIAYASIQVSSTQVTSGSELGSVAIKCQGCGGTAGATNAGLTLTGVATTPTAVFGSNMTVSASGVMGTTADGTPAAPALFLRSTGYGLYSTATSKLGLSVNGTDVFDYGETTASVATIPVALTASSATVKLSGISSATGTGYLCYTTGGAVSYFATACNSSLEEMKNIHGDITPEEAHRDVQALQPFWFQYKANPGKEDMPGFGARYTARVDKRLVSYGKDGKVATIPYGNMTAVLTANEKYLQSEVTRQQQQIDAQKQDIADLRKQIALLMTARR
jgi:hypothetical protein